MPDREPFRPGVGFVAEAKAEAAAWAKDSDRLLRALIAIRDQSKSHAEAVKIAKDALGPF